MNINLENKKSSGVNKPCTCAMIQDKEILSRNINKPENPKFYEVPYKGNPVLIAQK